MVVILKHRKYQHLFLLFASYFFFYYSSNYLITLLFLSTILDFYLGKEISKSNNPKKRKLLLISSLAGNLGLLGFFKYADFAIMQFNMLGRYMDLSESIPLLHLILPIGISFYTFQTISYTVDIYRKKLEPSESLSEFALFVSFFPQLIAGPIVRAKYFLPQLREKINSFETGGKLKQILLHPKNLRLGTTIIAMGLFKKMFFADNIAPMVNEIFSFPVGLESFTIILGAIAFGIQIYCDFSGYSDIAIGAALILGFKLPMNFNKPYFASSPSDFWRRWHISLSTWLRDYLYIPLGGNKKSVYRTYSNLLIVMFLGGLWHGAAWNFVIWGLLHGSFLAVHKALQNKFPSIALHPFFKSKIGKLFSIFITQYLVFLTWISFRINDTNYLIYAMQKYILLDFETTQTFDFILSHKLPILLMGLFFIIHTISYKTNLQEKISNLKLRYWFMFLVSCTLLILLFFDGNPNDFIYFQF